MRTFILSAILPLVLLPFLHLCSADAEEAYDPAAGCDNRSGDVPNETRIADCSKLLIHASGNDLLARIYVNRAWPLAATGRFGEALADYAAALKARPDWAILYNERAFAYLRMHRTELALRDYDHALKLDPKTVYALFGRGLVKISMGQRDSGLADIESAKALQPSVVEVFKKIGFVVPQ